MEVVNEEKDLRWKRADEFFGIHPVAFVDDIINAVNDYMCDATDALECSLRRDFPQKDLQVVRFCLILKKCQSSSLQTALVLMEIDLKARVLFIHAMASCDCFLSSTISSWKERRFILQ